jgi:hypothetical protein
MTLDAEVSGTRQLVVPTAYLAPVRSRSRRIHAAQSGQLSDLRTLQFQAAGPEHSFLVSLLSIRVKSSGCFMRPSIPVEHAFWNVEP